MTHQPTPAIELNNRRTINAWAMFDCANSSYALVIANAIFPPYFLSIVPEKVRFLGMTVSNSTLMSYAVMIAYLCIALTSPLLSGIADYGGKRKMFMRFFTTLGALACGLMFFFTSTSGIWIGFWAYVVATIGYGGGLVFYNAYLPIIASEDQYDAVSAKGFIYGYLGSVILLIVNLVMVMTNLFGLADAATASRISFLMVGLWWIGFAQIPYRRLPADATEKLKKDVLTRGFDELKKVWESLKTLPNVRHYLVSFFFYNGGVQAVLFLAAVFAEKELHYSTQELIILILILQLVGALGAVLFARFSDWKGNKTALSVVLIAWVVVCTLAYFVTDKTQFYGVAAMVGMVMGGVQALSRSSFSKLLPDDYKDSNAFFSFLDVMDKFSVVFATFAFGFAEQMTGNIRYSVLVLGSFILIGWVMMLGVKFRETRRA